MSIPYTQLGEGDQAKAGYFRIGHVVLRTPPTDILTNRVSGSERITTLRGSNDMIKLTGHGRWDVTVRWTSMLDETSSDPYVQWEDLRNIVAIFKAAPFVEIENYYVRQVLEESDASVSKDSAMAFGLRQLRISTHPDIVDAFDCSLTMTLFNYYPYSSYFAYRGPDGSPVGADRSLLFSNPSNGSGYIDTWIAKNLDHVGDPTYDGGPSQPWRSQTPGTVSFTWREYTAFKYAPSIVPYVSGVPNQETPSSGISAATPANSAGISKAGLNSSSGQYDALIQKYASQDGVSAAMIKAIMTQESKGNPNAVGSNLRFVPGSTTTYRTTIAGNTPNACAASLQHHILTDADGGTQFVAGYISQNGTGPDLGLMQLHYPGTATQYGPKNGRPVDFLNPETSIAAGTAYLQHLYSQGMTDEQIDAYNTGRIGAIDNLNPEYASQVLTYRNKFAQAADLPHPQPALEQAAASAAAGIAPGAPIGAATVTQPAAPSTSDSSGAIDPSLLKNLSPDEVKQLNDMLDIGWVFDYYTNDLIYLYRTQHLNFADVDHYQDNVEGGGAPFEMSPQQISILMVNNLAQIPLASYNYPTYQHIGSPSSQISMGFMSVGETVGEGDPIHAGVARLSGVINVLEDQYLRFRNLWRKVDSVHRMQAVYVENQVLNMLGIRGLMLDNLTTESVPSTADVMQVELAATQYENIFETLDSFKVNTIEGAAAGVTQSLINSGSLGNLAPSEQQVIPNLMQFATGRWTNDSAALCVSLLQLGAQKSDVFGGFSTLTPVSPTASQLTSMISVFAAPKATPSGGGLATAGATQTDSGGYQQSIQQLSQTNQTLFPAIYQHLTKTLQSGTWTTGDVMLVQALATNPSAQPVSPLAADLVKGALNATKALMQTQSVAPIYDVIFPILSGTDVLFAQNVNSLANSPAFAAQYNTAYQAGGPANSQTNNNGNHTAYKSMGLTTLKDATGMYDNNPGYYFVDDSLARDQVLRTELEAVVNNSQQTSNGTSSTPSLNTPYYEKEYNIQISDSEYVGKNADVDSLVQMTNLPGLSMAEAFPTFKLFLMEDEAGSVINCFDNFYSYATVTEIEIAKYRDQPDVAVIQITNVANLLAHQLFDDTLMGRYESSLTPYTPLAASPAPGIGGNPNSKVIAGRNLAGQNYSDGMVDGQKSRIPLQYVALQPGTKIQVRMGFSNNADLLVPVFTGRVTNFSTENDLMTITAESFLGELCTVPIMSNGKPLNDKDFGSEWFCNDAGDTLSVVEWLLTTQTAKHFGGWKLATASDPLITGLTWQNRTGRIVSDWKVSPTNILSQVGPALASSYDRSGENILINHINDYTGTPKQTRNGPNSGRSFYDSASSTILAVSFKYHIPKNSTFTTWDLIRDVGRRYPEFNIVCKQYGFPFSADATLVVAHPLDYFYARPPMIGDAETYATSPQLTPKWSDWWAQSGSKLWAEMITAVASDLSDTEWYIKMQITTPTDAVTMQTQLALIVQRTETFSGSDSGSINPNTLRSLVFGADKGLEWVNRELWTILDKSTIGTNFAAERKSRTAAVTDEVKFVWNSWVKYLENLQKTAGNGTISFDRLKPVRKYHYIDFNTIIHNGMEVNDKIYNAVRVGEDTIYANGNIPPAYRRVLDVTSLVNYPEKNLDTSAVRGAVGQSFLREEVGKMYRGEIVLRGVPEIEPFDCLVLMDPSTAITGIVEVDKVIHSFTMESGYITIVTPRCIVAINETASAGVLRMFQMVLAKTFSKTFNGVGSGGGLWGTVSNMSTSQQVITGLGATGGAAAVGTALFLAGGPIGWVGLAIAGALVYGVYVTGYKNQKANEVQVLPVTRWARPWIGGLQGYKITDFWDNWLGSQFNEWQADTIFPLIEMYRLANGTSNASAPLPVQGQIPAKP